FGGVAQKVGKSFDAEFEKLIAELDKDGFVREVTAAASTTTQSRPTISSQSRPTVPAAKAPAAKDDLDFTTIMPAIKRAPAPAPRPAAPDATAQQRAKEQEAALYKARQEAEAREAEERQRREEEDRRLKEKEDAARRAREEEEVRAHQAREMEEARVRAGQRKREQEDERARKAGLETQMRLPTQPPSDAAKASGGSLDALMADLDSFSQREDEERQARQADDRKL